MFSPLFKIFLAVVLLIPSNQLSSQKDTIDNIFKKEKYSVEAGLGSIWCFGDKRKIFFFQSYWLFFGGWKFGNWGVLERWPRSKDPRYSI